MGTKQTNGHTKNGKRAPEAKPSKKQVGGARLEASLERGSKRKLESDRPSKARLEDGRTERQGEREGQREAPGAHRRRQEKGFLTYDEVNDALPAPTSSPIRWTT